MWINAKNEKISEIVLTKEKTSGILTKLLGHIETITATKNKIKKLLTSDNEYDILIWLSRKTTKNLDN